MIETYTPNLFAAQWPEVTKPTDGASAVWRKKRPGRKRVDDDDKQVLPWWIIFRNTLRTRPNGRYIADNIFVFLHENLILFQITLLLIVKGTVNNEQAQVQIIAWCQTGSHYLNQWCPHWTIYAPLDLNLLNGTYTKTSDINTRPLTHWGRDKMAAISQTTHSNAFSWIKMLENRLKFHWSLFPRVEFTIFHHWFR